MCISSRNRQFLEGGKLPRAQFLSGELMKLVRPIWRLRALLAARVVSRSLYQPVACKSARPVCEASSIDTRFPAGSPGGVIIRVVADWLQCRWSLRRDIRVTRARTLLQCTSLQVARRVGSSMEAFEPNRPSACVNTEIACAVRLRSTQLYISGHRGCNSNAAGHCSLDVRI
jgi:hypothetical protein